MMGRMGQLPEALLATPKRFRELRESMQMSQAQLAEYLGVNTRTVGRWELGRTRIPRSCWLLLLNRVLTLKQG